MNKLPERIWISLQQALDLVLDRTGADEEAVKRALIEAFGAEKIETQGYGRNHYGLSADPTRLGAEWRHARVSWKNGTFKRADFGGLDIITSLRRFNRFHGIIVCLEHVTRWLESANGTPARDSHATPAKDKGGRDPGYDWGAFQREILRIANTPEGLSTQRDLVKQMLDWCTGEWTECPDERTIRRRVKKYTDGVIPPSQ